MSPNVPQPSEQVKNQKPSEECVIDTSDYKSLDETGQKAILESSILGHLEENKSEQSIQILESLM